MNKTKIEWTDYTYNPVTGCTKRCPYCYAHRLAKGRLRKLYLANTNVAPGCDPDDPFSPRFWRNRLEQPCTLRKPSKIFTCDMGDLWDPHIPPDWIEAILAVASFHERHTFQFLTKQPIRASIYDFPPNAWVGITVESDNGQCWSRQAAMNSLTATVRFISYEPLLGPISYIPPWADWIIIGAMTGPNATKPEELWVQTLIDIADEMSIPVFLKHNLEWPLKREEFPK
jgi:protein gp37